MPSLIFLIQNNRIEYNQNEDEEEKTINFIIIINDNQ